jgi:hypothetical protein
MTMTKRFIIYIAVFNLLLAGAMVPGLADALRLEFAPIGELLLPLVLLGIPPLAIAEIVSDFVISHILPHSGPVQELEHSIVVTKVVSVIICCVLYYGFMFVVFLPMGLRRGPRLAVPRDWRQRWKTFATFVVIIHVILILVGGAVMQKCFR